MQRRSYNDTPRQRSANARQDPRHRETPGQRSDYARQNPRYSEPRRRQAQGARRMQRSASSRKGGPRKMPFIIAMLVICAVACLVLFLNCSSKEDDQTANPTDIATTEQTGDAPALQAQLGPNVDDRLKESGSANDVRPSDKVVYLTFDDGPSGHTDRILDMLDEYGIKATWFVIGDTGHLDSVSEIWERGHQVGLHSYDHNYEFIYADPGNFVSDIDKIGSAVEDHLGFRPALIRFPGGSVNGYDAGRSNQFTQAAANQGWHYFDWNVSIGDSTQPPASPDALVANIMREAEGCNSCCVLMHDSDFKPTTPDALPQVIEYFISEGYAFDVLAADSFGYHF